MIKDDANDRASLHECILTPCMTVPGRHISQPPPMIPSRHGEDSLQRSLLDAGDASWGGAASTQTSSAAQGSSTLAETAVTGSCEQSLAPTMVCALDEEQQRCVNRAYHISFQGHPRVKLKPTPVSLPNGATFLIVDRFVTGNTEDVYEKNKKIWEHVPIGQARVFARRPMPLSPASLTPSPPQVTREVRGEAAEPTVQRTREGFSSLKVTLRDPSKPLLGAETSFVSNAGTTDPVCASASDVQQLCSSRLPPQSHGDWTQIASVVGLRKIGHWREANTAFSTPKGAVKTAIALEKVDGEPGHISAFTWLGERYWVIGCRYQHIVTRLDVPEEDLMRYVAPRGSPLASANSSTSTATEEQASPMPSSRVNTTTPSSKTVLAQRGFTDDKGTGWNLPPRGVPSLTDAPHLDLALRMARLWRHILRTRLGRPADEEKTQQGECDSEPAGTLEELHKSVAADRRTLCFDAVLPGWERLQVFSGDSALFAHEGKSKGLTATSFVAPTDSDGSQASSCTSTSSDAIATAALSALALRPTAIPLWFYAVTWDSALDERGWCMEVRAALHFFDAFGLPVVPSSAEVRLGTPAYEAQRQLLLSSCSSAGAVLYGSSGDDGGDGAAMTRAVVQLWKCRAYPHSLERAVQEYVVTHRLCGDPLQSKVKKKLNSLTRETRLSVKEWEFHRLPFLLEFALWLHREKLLTPSTDLAALKVIRNYWLTYQGAYEAERRSLQGQRCRCPSTQPGGSQFFEDPTPHPIKGGAMDIDGQPGACHADPEAALNVPPFSTEGPESMCAILLVGPQGCGKSTMARILYCLLEETGATPRWINQDEVGSRRAYLESIRRVVTQRRHTHLLLDKMNLDEKARADYAAAGVTPALVVAWTHTKGVEAMVEACYDRIVQRGSCHRTFCPDDTTSGRSPLLLPASLKSLDLPPSLSLDGLRASSPNAGAGTPAASDTAPFFLCSADGISPNASPPPSSSVSASPVSRWYGILETCAKRYQAPVNAPFVELDITWSCKRSVEVVWTALQKKSTRALPDLAHMHVEAALQTTFAYEQLLENYPTRIEQAVLRGPPCSTALNQLENFLSPPLIVPKGLRRQHFLEVLLHDFHGDPSPTALVRYAQQVGIPRSVRVQAVVLNSKVVLLLLLPLGVSSPTESVAATRPLAASPLKDLRVEFQPKDGCAGGLKPYAETSENVARAEDPSMAEFFAVLAKAKNVTQEYCAALAQRMRRDPEDDPYCVVRWLPAPMVLPFTMILTHA